MFVVTKKDIEFECRYDEIKKLDVSTNWFTRGVTIETGSGIQNCSTGDEAAAAAMGNIIKSAMPGSKEGVLGGETPSDVVFGVIKGAVRSNEPIVGVMVTIYGNALVATEQRLLIVTEEGLECDCAYADITAFEVRTGWWTRGISFSSSSDDFECETEDRDAVVAMGNIIRDRTPHIDSPDVGDDEGGLKSRVKGVFDTATGGDIRKYEEFVDASTTVLVGLHRDQAAVVDRLTKLENATEAIRRSQGETDTRLSTVDTAVAELRSASDEVGTRLSGVETGISELRASQAEVVEELDRIERTPPVSESRDERNSQAVSINRTALVVSVVAIVVSILSLVLRFV